MTREMATSEWHLIMLALVLPTPAAKWFGRRAIIEVSRERYFWKSIVL